MRKKLEEVLQNEIIIFCNTYHFKDIVCIPVVNELARGSNKTVLRGASDLICAMPNNTTIYVELKVYKNGQSPAQKLFQKRIENLGHKYYLCRSLEQFKSIIKEHLTDKKCISSNK